jgi:hypothetical protein
MRRVGWALLILAICFAAGTVLWGAATERSTSLVCGEIKSKVCEQQTDPMLGFVLAALIAILGLVLFRRLNGERASRRAPLSAHRSRSS